MVRISLLTSAANPAEFKVRREEPIEQTTSMLFGSALHAFVLEPNKFDEQYYVVDTSDDELNKDGSIKAAALKHLKSMDIQKAIIPRQWVDYFKKISEIIVKKGYNNIIDKCEKEHQLYAAFNVLSQSFEPCERCDIDYDHERLYLSGRVDAFKHDVVIDVKTVRPDYFYPKKLYYHALDNGYNMQLAAYKEMLAINSLIDDDTAVIMLLVSNDLKQPDVIMYRIDDAMLLDARERLKDRMTIIRNCLLNDYYPIIPVDEKIIYMNSIVIY